MKRFPSMLLAGGLFAAAMSFGGAVQPAAAQDTNGSAAQFIQKSSPHSFGDTVSSLKRAIANNGMMVLGNLNQGGALSATGLSIQAQSFMVGNPSVGKQLFQMNPAVGAVIPLRIYVWGDKDGKAGVGYFQPSSELTAISPGLSKPGMMLDQKFKAIVDQATQ